jgi:hypothetical protein
MDKGRRAHGRAGEYKRRNDSDAHGIRRLRVRGVLVRGVRT